MAYELWESCLGFPDFTRSACASWVQAWGSIAAILFAAYAGRSAEREAQRHAISNARTFASFANGAITAMWNAARSSDAVDLELNRSALEVVAARATSIRLELLPIGSTGAIITLQSQCARALEAARLYTEGAMSAQDLDAKLRRYVENVQIHCQTLGREHPLMSFVLAQCGLGLAES